MAKKVVLFFFITLSFFFISIAAQAQNTAESSLNKIEKATDNLESIEKLPGAEEISLIASTIKNAAETYRSAKSQITNTISYCQKIIRSAKELLKKMENSGLKIKKYIKDKISLFSKKYGINSLLT